MERRQLIRIEYTSSLMDSILRVPISSEMYIKHNGKNHKTKSTQCCTTKTYSYQIHEISHLIGSANNTTCVTFWSNITRSLCEQFTMDNLLCLFESKNEIFKSHFVRQVFHMALTKVLRAHFHLHSFLYMHTKCSTMWFKSFAKLHHFSAQIKCYRILVLFFFI